MTKFEVAICMSPNFIVEATNPATTPGMDTAIELLSEEDPPRSRFDGLGAFDLNVHVAPPYRWGGGLAPTVSSLCSAPRTVVPVHLSGYSLGYGESRHEPRSHPRK